MKAIQKVTSGELLTKKVMVKGKVISPTGGAGP
jgi:hypothetical protein